MYFGFVSRCLLIAVLSIILIFGGCNDDTGSGVDLKIVTDLQVIKNPNGVAPLTALLKITTNTEASLSLRIVGKNGTDSDIRHDFPDFGTTFEIPVLGLYPAHDNQVEISFLDGTGAKISSELVSIQTEVLNANMPQVEVNVSSSGSIKPGLNLVNYFGHNGNFLPQRPLMFDEFGDPRWYLNFSGHPVLSNLFYDNGMNRLQNGNLVFGDGRTEALYEIDMLGEIINTWDLQGFGFHHHVIEKPNGNLLVTVNDNSIPTVEDLVLEIDRSSGDIVNRWDLNASLDNTRRAWNTDLADLNVDWFHANAIEYSATDNSLIVSGRTQGTVKLSENNQVVWILAPHKDWNTSGDGTELDQFLLQPLDAQGTAIADVQVLEGETNHPDFEWAWYQHSPILLPNGNLMVFDNGENRNYSGTGNYS
ncbi:MAG: aryl-sulfate sulfotransferase, partial [Cyclobacteriaceae bacterium]